MKEKKCFELSYNLNNSSDEIPIPNIFIWPRTQSRVLSVPGVNQYNYYKTH